MVEAGYRIFINGFPKAGTHLVEQMIRVIAPPVSKEHPWIGTFDGHAWTEDWVDDYKMYRNLGRLVDRTYGKGHAGYRRDIELFLWGIGATVLFVYRDPRDVAVSQVYHILGNGRHFEPEPVREAVAREGFKAGLRMGIEGWQGERTYPGVMARWRHYAQWLEVPWVLSLRFEDLLTKRQEMAKAIIQTCVARASLQHGRLARVKKSVLEDTSRAMAEASKRTRESATFRKGKAGRWRDYFDEELIAFAGPLDQRAADKGDPVA